MSSKSITPQKTSTGRWRQGTSGNPAGRPAGSRNKSTVFLEELLSGQSEALIQKGVELSLKGDTPMVATIVRWAMGGSLEVERFPAGSSARDLGSRNGPWANGRRVLGAARLRPGDELRYVSRRRPGGSPRSWSCQRTR